MEETLVLTFIDLKRWIEDFIPESQTSILHRPLSQLLLGSAVLVLVIVAHFCISHLSQMAQMKHNQQKTNRLQQWPAWPCEIMMAVASPARLLLWAFTAALILLCLAPDERKARIYSATVVHTFSVAAFIASFWFLLRMIHFVMERFKKIGTDGHTRVAEILSGIIADAARVILVVTGFYLAVHMVHLPTQWSEALARVGSILFIGVVAWFAIRVVMTLDDWGQIRFDVKDKNNLRARQIFTQVGFIQKVSIFLIAVLSIASTLMLFEGVRRFGTTLLASAGLASIVAGLAAQQTLSNFFTGLQIAITQPIRIDDVVVINGEFGNVEEISLTHVVVRIWDLRRLVVPINYFLTTPFENWTRTSANVMGTVMLYLDYSVPIDLLREVGTALIKKSSLWDGKVATLAVTDLKEATMEVRLLMSAANSDMLSDLRMIVREKMIEYVQKNHPRSLPHYRIQSSGVETHAETNGVFSAAR